MKKIDQKIIIVSLSVILVQIGYIFLHSKKYIMKIPKTIQKFISKHPELNLRVEIIKYRFKNYTSIGFDIIKEDNGIVVALEPNLGINHKMVF
jgi:archaellum component FlaF (FlaF/FlaG flagellin family)